MTLRRARRLAAAVLIGATVLACTPTGALAQGPADFSVSPAGANPTDRPFFAYELHPGDIVEDTLTIANLADVPRTFRIYPADGYNTTDVGSFALRQEDEPRVGLGSWVTVGVDRWTVAPGTQVDIPVRIEVPLDVTPGDHVGGVVAVQLPTEATETSDGFGLWVERGIGARIYVRVAGPLRPSLAIEEFDSTHSAPISPTGSGTATTSFRIVNTGNTRMSPEVLFTAEGPFGSVETVDLGRFADLIPGSSVVVTHDWDGIPSGGKITQSVTLTDDDFVYTRSLSFWVVPWWLLGAVVLVLVVGFLGLRRWRRRRRRSPIVPAEPRDATAAVAAAALALGLIATQVTGTPTAHAQEGGTVLVEPDAAIEVGDELTVTGSGWAARSNLLIEFCGNEARDGSTDCALREARTVATSFDGRFAIIVEVAEPPVACPCVLRVWTVTGATTMTTVPLEFEDFEGPTEPATTDIDTDTNRGESDGGNSSEPAALRAEVRITGGDRWASWFGLPTTRTAVVTFHNDGGEPSTPGVASIAWGAGDEPTGFLPLVPVPAIDGGASMEERLDIELDAFTTGRVTVRGDLLSVGDPVSFVARTTVTPWGLIALAAAAAFAAITVLVRFLWRHRRVRAALSRAEMADAAAPPALVDRGLTPDGEDPLEVALHHEIAAVFDQALDLYPATDLDDETFVALMLELSAIAADRVEHRVALRPEQREGLDHQIADAVLESFGFVPVEA